MDNTKLVGLLAVTFGAGVIVGEHSMKKRIIKRVRANQSVGNKIVADILTRATQPDCTPEEVREMVEEGTMFLKMIQE